MTEMSTPHPNAATLPPWKRRNPFVSAVLAWAVPGLGHAYQGRWGKAALFLVLIYGVFFTGYALGAWRVVYFRWDKAEIRYPYLAQVGVGLATAPAWVTSNVTRADWPTWLATLQARPFTPAEIDAICSKYPVDSFGEARRVAELKEKHGIVLVSEEEHDNLHRDLGKQMDLALIYTMVAGLLNMLVILDAAFGPALGDDRLPTT